MFQKLLGTKKSPEIQGFLINYCFKNQLVNHFFSNHCIVF
ncbi:hypothetical protein FCR2A7T_16800 [Flavobacterium cauense R2A-7]|nr:hypothetical protein FCR2A7T_16800 [Flavobacterium cauense R2A-7]